jgi:hypothetical protein
MIDVIPERRFSRTFTCTSETRSLLGLFCTTTHGLITSMECMQLVMRQTQCNTTAGRRSPRTRPSVESGQQDGAPCSKDHVQCSRAEVTQSRTLEGASSGPHYPPSTLLRPARVFFRSPHRPAGEQPPTSHSHWD